jgi:hypothetical protein
MNLAMLMDISDNKGWYCLLPLMNLSMCRYRGEGYSSVIGKRLLRSQKGNVSGARRLSAPGDLGMPEFYRAEPSGGATKGFAAKSYGW